MINENEEKYDDINKLNPDFDMSNSNDQSKISIVYDETFNLIIKIISNVNEEKERNSIYNIMKTIVKNILTFPEEEKYRKLKLSNLNIQKVFQVEGVYDFFNFLGFKEDFMDNELYMVLREPQVELFSLVYSYLSLLIVNEEDSGDNYYEKSNEVNYVELPNFNEISSRPLRSSKKKSIVDILKETKDSRVNGVEDSYSQWNNYIPFSNLNNSNSNNLSNNLNTNNLSNNSNLSNSSNKKDIKSILKETAASRRNNSNYFSQYYNAVPNENFPTSQNSNSNNNNSRFVSLNDLTFKNPDINNIFKHSFKVNDEIGKQCLHLSNEFRKKNGLSPLLWDDHVWKISFEHSRNMGIYKVKFGHDGFNERIRKLPFYYSLACENVFMCQGVSEYNLAEMGVNGWINSPGHRKNLLSKTSHCSIAVFRNDSGEFFLTQIFVKK